MEETRNSVLYTAHQMFLGNRMKSLKVGRKQEIHIKFCGEISNEGIT